MIWTSKAQTTVLMIDADPRVRRRVRAGLTTRGHAFIEADTCTRGVRLARGRRPDAVIVNTGAFARDVLALCQELRRHKRTREIPVLVICATRQLGEVEELFQAGATICVSPSIQLEDLLRKVEVLIRGEGGPASSDVPDDLRAIYEGALVAGGLLGDMAEVYSGIAPRAGPNRRAASPGPGWAGVITEDKVYPFWTRSVDTYLRFDRSGLLRVPAREEFDHEEKVILRRTAPPMAAAVDATRSPVAAGVYSVVPARGLQCSYLACLLNSRLTDFYLNRVRSPVATRGSTYLRPTDIEAIPVIVPPVRVQRVFGVLVAELSSLGPNPAANTSRVRRVHLLREMNNTLFQIYNVSDALVRRLTDLHF